MKTFEYLASFLIGVRPDIAITVFVLFCIALVICITIAKKNKLFYFSRKESWNKPKDSER